MAGQSLKISGDIRTSLFGKAFQKKQRTVSSVMAIPFSALLAPAKTGNLTTRTSDSVGTLTMDVGHGFVDADIIDLYWTNADGTYGRRIGVVVGTVAVNSVPITAGAGDVLPADEFEITAMKPQSEVMVVTGDNLTAIIADADSEPATVRVMDNAGTPATAQTIELDLTQDAYDWDVDNTIDNPLAGITTTTIRLSHGDSTKSVTIRGAFYYD